MLCRVLWIYLKKKELRKMERLEAEKWQSSPVFLSKNPSGNMVIGWREQNQKEIKRVMLRLLVRNKKDLLIKEVERSWKKRGHLCKRYFRQKICNWVT